MNYWINSNSGDYISLDNFGNYTLTLLSRYVDVSDGSNLSVNEVRQLLPGRIKYIPTESISITPTQFALLKGFIPIKQKKLFNNRQRKTYGPTLSDGSKGKGERIKVPTKAESREEILKSLGL